MCAIENRFSDLYGDLLLYFSFKSCAEMVYFVGLSVVRMRLKAEDNFAGKKSFQKIPSFANYLQYMPIIHALYIYNFSFFLEKGTCVLHYLPTQCVGRYINFETTVVFTCV